METNAIDSRFKALEGQMQQMLQSNHETQQYIQKLEMKLRIAEENNVKEQQPIIEKQQRREDQQRHEDQPGQNQQGLVQQQERCEEQKKGKCTIL